MIIKIGYTAILISEADFSDKNKLLLKLQAENQRISLIKIVGKHNLYFIYELLGENGPFLIKLKNKESLAELEKLNFTIDSQTIYLSPEKNTAVYKEALSQGSCALQMSDFFLSLHFYTADNPANFLKKPCLYLHLKKTDPSSAETFLRLNHILPDNIEESLFLGGNLLEEKEFFQLSDIDSIHRLIDLAMHQNWLQDKLAGDLNDFRNALIRVDSKKDHKANTEYNEYNEKKFRPESQLITVLPEPPKFHLQQHEMAAKEAIIHGDFNLLRVLLHAEDKRSPKDFEMLESIHENLFLDEKKMRELSLKELTLSMLVAKTEGHIHNEDTLLRTLATCLVIARENMYHFFVTHYAEKEFFYTISKRTMKKTNDFEAFEHWSSAFINQTIYNIAVEIEKIITDNPPNKVLILLKSELESTTKTIEHCQNKKFNKINEQQQLANAINAKAFQHLVLIDQVLDTQKLEYIPMPSVYHYNPVSDKESLYEDFLNFDLRVSPNAIVEGSSLLYYAIFHQRYLILKLLLDNGADIYLTFGEKNRTVLKEFTLINESFLESFLLEIKNSDIDYLHAPSVFRQETALFLESYEQDLKDRMDGFLTSLFTKDTMIKRQNELAEYKIALKKAEIFRDDQKLIAQIERTVQINASENSRLHGNMHEQLKKSKEISGYGETSEIFLEKLLSKNKGLKEKIKDIDHALIRMHMAYTEIGEENKRLMYENDSLRKAVHEKEEEIENLTLELTNYKKLLKESEETIIRLKADIADQQKIIDKKDEQLKTQDNQIAQYNETVTDYKKTIADQHSMIEQLIALQRSSQTFQPQPFLTDPSKDNKEPKRTVGMFQ